MVAESGLTLPLRGNRQVLFKCFLDVQELKLANDWREGFLNGLKRSCLFVPIVSEAAVAPIMASTDDATTEDNLLLEFETALDLRQKGRLQILPLLVGERTLDGGCHEYNFARCGPHMMPSALSKSGKCIRHTMTDLLSFQGLKVNEYLEQEDEEAPVELAAPLIDRIHQALIDNAWGRPDGPRRCPTSRLAASEGTSAGAHSTGASAAANCRRSAEAAKDCLNLWRHWVDGADATELGSAAGGGGGDVAAFQRGAQAPGAGGARGKKRAAAVGPAYYKIGGAAGGDDGDADQDLHELLLPLDGGGAATATSSVC